MPLRCERERGQKKKNQIKRDLKGEYRFFSCLIDDI